MSTPPGRIMSSAASPPSKSWRANIASRRKSCPSAWISSNRKLVEVERAESDLTQLRKEQAAALESYRTLAAQLTARRATAGRALAKTSLRACRRWHGGRALPVEITPLATAGPAVHGVDQIEFRVTANPGQPLRPLAKVASGGELLASRWLCGVLRGARARAMVFDEVDSGIGGAVAEIVGRELHSLAARAQVLCVTHLRRWRLRGTTICVSRS